MNNEERFELAKAYLDEIKPLKDIYVKYSVYKSKFSSIPTDAEMTERKVIVYQNTSNGKTQFNNPYTGDEASYVLEVPNSVNVTELRYIESANTFALCGYVIDVFGKEDKRTSRCLFSSAYLIFPDKSTKIYNGKYSSGFGHYYYNWISEWLKLDMLNDNKKSWNESFQKVFPFALIGGNTYYIIDDRNMLQNWIRYKEPTRREGKMQNTIDNLLNLPLPSIDQRKLKFSKQKYWWTCNGENINVFVSKVNDETVCLRWFRLNEYSKEFFETSRLYVDKKKQYFCRKNSLGEFIAQTGKMNAENFRAQKVIFGNKDSFKGTRLEYYESVLPEIPAENVANVLWAFIYHPLTEMFWKQGMKECVINFTKSYANSQNFEKFLSDRYGGIDISKKSVAKILGINNFQISCLNMIEGDNKSHYGSSALKRSKEALEVTDISSFTNEQSEKLFKFVADESCLYPASEIFRLLKSTYSLKMAFSMIDEVMKIKEEVISVPYNYSWSATTYMRTEGAAQVYRDYLSMVNQMNEGNNLRPHFETVDDIKNMHDGLLEIFNARKDAIMNEAFAMKVSKWKKYEYEGKDFAVVIPTKATDLAKEGFELKHCVKSYIGRVTQGATNIVFIRKKEDLEKPFFTVEITNDDTIQQVHGFSNRNADTENGMTEFVKEWAKKRKLKVSNFNKVR